MFTKQQTGAAVAVDSDFPELPKFPTLTISADRAAMEQHEEAMQQWYYQHRTVTLNKLEALAEEIRKLKQK